MVMLVETPEYYASESIKFLNDICNEKDKKINLFNKLLNISIIFNIVMLSYITFAIYPLNAYWLCSGFIKTV